MTQTRPANSFVRNPDLDFAVESLAAGIQGAMRALYNVQMTLVENLPRSHSSKYVFEDFKKIRDLFRTEWEKYSIFLQNCSNYCDEWISLCDFTVTMPPPVEGFALARDVLMLAMDVYDEARDMKNRHEGLHRELRKHKSMLASVLVSSEKPMARPKGGQSRAFAGSNAQFFQESLRPRGIDSLTEAYAAVSNIGTAMGDLLVFLKDHVDHLTSISSKRFTTFPMTINELQISAQKWRHTQCVLLAGISSISESSDAVTVDPVVGSRHGSPPFRGGDSWRSYDTKSKRKAALPMITHHRSRRSFWEFIGCLFGYRR